MTKKQEQLNNVANNGSGDEKLLHQAAAGDNQALDQLMLQYKWLVRHKAKSMYMAGSDIEDIIQEGMIGLFQAIRTYRFQLQVPFSAYASQCISARIIDAVRKASRRKHQPLNESISLQAMVQNEDEFNLLQVLADTSGVNPEHAFLEREELQNLGEFVRSELSELERDVLLQYIETGSYKQTASNLDCTVKTVDNALDRSRKKFRKYRRLKSGEQRPNEV